MHVTWGHSDPQITGTLSAPYGWGGELRTAESVVCLVLSGHSPVPPQALGLAFGVITVVGKLGISRAESDGGGARARPAPASGACGHL